jgi:hypothetical protein
MGEKEKEVKLMGGRKQNCIDLIGLVLWHLALFSQGSNEQAHKGKPFFTIIGPGDESFIVFLLRSSCGHFRY